MQGPRRARLAAAVMSAAINEELQTKSRGDEGESGERNASEQVWFELRWIRGEKPAGGQRRVWAVRSHLHLDGARGWMDGAALSVCSVSIALPAPTCAPASAGPGCSCRLREALLHKMHRVLHSGVWTARKNARGLFAIIETA